MDGSVVGGEDAIAFGPDIGFENLSLSRGTAGGVATADLIIEIVDRDALNNMVATGDKLIIKDWFDDTRKVEWLRFADGQDIRIADIQSFTTTTNVDGTIVGTNGSDWWVGSNADDPNVFLRRVTDFGFGSGGDDLVSGDANNDLVSGGDGNDQVYGGDGNDTVFGDAGEDKVWGGAGADIVSGGKGDDEFRAATATTSIVSGAATATTSCSTALIRLRRSSAPLARRELRHGKAVFTLRPTVMSSMEWATSYATWASGRRRFSMIPRRTS